VPPAEVFVEFAQRTRFVAVPFSCMAEPYAQREVLKMEASPCEAIWGKTCEPMRVWKPNRPAWEKQDCEG
jgi:hypothetical protein